MNAFEEVIVELSFNCNLSCAMCGFGKNNNPYNKSHFMGYENYKKILQQIGDKTRSIRLNGRGESTIHPQFVDILTYTRERYPELGINLFSNFSFHNEKILRALIQNRVQLYISMDSPDDTELSEIRRGANARFVKNNIKQLESMTPRPFIIFTIQEANLHRIYDIARFAADNNCQILYNTIRRDEGIEPFVQLVNERRQDIQKQFERVSELYSGRSGLRCLYPDQLAGISLPLQGSTQTHGTMQSCPALHRELCIFYEGTVTPCNMFNPYVYGNIFGLCPSDS